MAQKQVWDKTKKTSASWRLLKKVYFLKKKIYVFCRNPAYIIFFHMGMQSGGGELSVTFTYCICSTNLNW